MGGVAYYDTEALNILEYVKLLNYQCFIYRINITKEELISVMKSEYFKGVRFYEVLNRITSGRDLKIRKAIRERFSVEIESIKKNNSDLMIFVIERYDTESARKLKILSKMLNPLKDILLEYQLESIDYVSTNESLAVLSLKRRDSRQEKKKCYLVDYNCDYNYSIEEDPNLIDMLFPVTEQQRRS